ncbi:YbaB/EbfC family nucleoid-associated protein [Saccharopolyspora hirsuta]|uniref:YbaB/EbfC family nucleoid-associated protein n=1 Tax=Saccharopolyspora hirsuta TaxID=1837 RepID=A0A5M7BI20_SACHI|nr:YbaB/EbfC family nucleoid-associated protein [Saccharopolyspora hirsuta]KAA5829169.1 YbaB/EbfC family nucleoid-associated protein [Saccharopolyspora hirsuta]
MNRVPFDMQAELDKAMREITAQQQKIKQLEADLRARSVTARSKDRMLSATVDASGGLTKLEFHDERYRSMAKAELADAITKVVGQARDEMTSQVNAAVEPHVGDVAELRDSLHNGSHWGDFLAPLFAMQREASNFPSAGQRDGR